MSETATTAALNLDPDEVARRVAAVLHDPLYWFPVRHHSHNVARHLAVALRERSALRNNVHLSQIRVRNWDMGKSNQ